MWPLLVFEVPVSTGEDLERKISPHFRRWFGLPRSPSSITLYGHSNKLQLPLRSWEVEFKVTRTREAARSWNRGEDWEEMAPEAVQQVVRVVTHGRVGLGSFPTSQTYIAKGKEKSRLVQGKVRAAIEKRSCRMVAIGQQGTWTRWDNILERKVTWVELWKAEPRSSSLSRWGVTCFPASQISTRRAKLRHRHACCASNMEP